MKKAFCFEKFTLNKHRHTYFSDGTVYNYLAYVASGKCKLISSEKTLNIDTGDVFYIPLNCKYHSHWSSETTIEFLSLGFSPFDVNDNLNFDLQVVNCGDEIKARIKGISTDTSDISLETLGDFCGILSDLKPLMAYKKKTKGARVVERAEEFISGNPACNIPEIAKACMVSEPYLYTVFKNELHTTPNNFKQSILCKKGAELLKTTDASVDEISSFLNFSSTSYFRKVMKKHTGKTPTQIRKTAVF